MAKNALSFQGFYDFDDCFESKESLQLHCGNFVIAECNKVCVKLKNNMP